MTAPSDGRIPATKISVLHSITRMILGGAQLTALQTCERLDRRRFESTLLCGPQRGSEGDLLTEARGKVRTLVIPTLVRQIDPALDVRAYLAIDRHIRRNRYAIVHTHTTKAGLLARHSAWKRETPVIVHTVHGWQWTHARSRGMNRLIVAAERRAAAYTDKLIVVTERDREKGLEAGVGKPDQYVCIESAIDLTRFDPAGIDAEAARKSLDIPAGCPVAGTVGRFAYQKAPDVMLRAAKHLLETDPDLHFIYVGDGPLRNEVMKAVFPSDHPRLRLVGLSNEVPSLVRAMDVFLLSSRYEGLPRVAVEAMALEKPVVSTPADGILEVVEEGVTGRLCPFEDWRALAEETLTLIRDPDLRRRMGNHARSRVVRRFGLDSMVSRIERLYEELLAEPNRRRISRRRPF